MLSWGVIFLLLLAPAVFAYELASFASGGPLVGPGILLGAYTLIIIAVLAGLAGVFKTALYIYAKQGRSLAAFADDLMHQALARDRQLR